MNFLVRAAGGIVVRDGRLLLVHRPKYDDWSFPKGKLEDGETWEDGALREVEEETGLRCTLGKLIGFTRYRDRRGRDKVVQYWAMDPVEGEFRPTGEIDELRWVRVEGASRILTYDHDRQLLQDAVD